MSFDQLVTQTGGMFNSSTTLLRFENSEWKDDDK
jgi:hypothetical protein